MHVLPLEIQHNIFVLACTDGGRTGLALSLTSRSYHDAVQPVRLHSVAIRTFSHIEGVLQSYKRDQAALEARGSSLKPRVRHLLLTPAEKGLRHQDEEEEVERYRAPAIALLQLVGPTLTTLAYTMRFRFTGLASMCPMPKLEELTILLNPRTYRIESGLGLPRPLPSYPALRKLHIVVWFGAAVPDLLGWWAEAAPNVADLRLTNMGWKGRGWVESMIDRDRTKRPYPSVRRMFIEPYQKPLGGRCGNPRANHRYFLAGLEEMRERTPENIQFVLEKRESKGQPFDYVADVERYWTDGVNGGLGAWGRLNETAEAHA